MAERVLLTPSVRSAITAHVRAAPKTETGGILIGRDGADDTLEITLATGPGPKAVRRKHFFLRDKAFLQRVLDREVARCKGAVEYVGEWRGPPLALAHRAPSKLSDRPPRLAHRGEDGG